MPGIVETIPAKRTLAKIPTKSKRTDMSSGITRRDFIDGVACSVIAGSGLLSRAGRAGTEADYPPGLTGMRGSRDADLAVGHALRDGAKFHIDDYPVSEEVDFAVVG